MAVISHVPIKLLNKVLTIGFAGVSRKAGEKVLFKTHDTSPVARFVKVCGAYGWSTSKGAIKIKTVS